MAIRNAKDVKWFRLEATDSQVDDLIEQRNATLRECAQLKAQESRLGLALGASMANISDAAIVISALIAVATNKGLAPGQRAAARELGERWMKAYQAYHHEGQGNRLEDLILKTREELAQLRQERDTAREQVVAAHDIMTRLLSDDLIPLSTFAKIGIQAWLKAPEGPGDAIP